jgi:hypothetical protein
MDAIDIAILARHRFKQSKNVETDTLLEEWLAEKIKNYHIEHRMISVSRLIEILKEMENDRFSNK